MATTTTFRRLEAGLQNRFEQWNADIRDRWTRYQQFRRALDELSGLSDRDLSDLGIARANIRGIAHEAAYGDMD